MNFFSKVKDIVHIDKNRAKHHLQSEKKIILYSFQITTYETSTTCHIYSV